MTLCHPKSGGHVMGRSLLLWLVGIPLPIVLLLYFFVFR
jgi:hypothetical protein